MNNAILTAGLGNPTTRAAMTRRFCEGRSVLDIGCVNHLIGNTEKPEWLHGQIKLVARSLVGVDYLPNEVEALRNQGYDVICGDATKPLPLTGPFDVIHVANLIEHLSSFEGLFSNITNLLARDGVLLITTPNPFYREQYFYSAFKNDIIVNSEHTCWLDPVVLDQLAARFGLVTETVEWVKEKWPLQQVVLNGEMRQFDIFSGHWRFKGAPGLLDRVAGGVLDGMARFLLPRPVYARLQERYEANLRRFLWLKAESWLFGIAWRLYRPLIVTAAINKFELYTSVIRPQPASGDELIREAHVFAATD